MDKNEENIFDLSDQLKPKRKHFSKRTKKAWRKHTKVADVLQFIDEKREEDLINIALEHGNKESIFALDKKSTKQLKGTLPVKQKKPRSNVFFKYLQPDPISHPPVRRVKSEDGNNNAEKEQPTKKMKIPKKKLDLEGLKVSEENDISSKQIATCVPTYDLWGTSTEKATTGKESLLDADVLLYTREQTKQRQTEKIPDTRRRVYRKVNPSEVKGLEKVDEKMAKQRLKKLKALPSWLPAVEIPHPSTSYNPPRKAVAQMVRKVQRKKKAAEKEEQQLYRSLTKFIPTPEEAAKIEEENQKEMAAGLDDKAADTESEDEEEVASSDVDDEEMAKVQHLRSLQSKDRRRLQSKRRRQAEELKKIEKAKKKKLNRKRLHEVNRIRHHLESMKKAQVQARLRRGRLVQKEIKKMYKTRRLGKLRYEGSNTDTIVNKNPSGNLINVNTAGNLLFERYDSLLKRNILEVRNKRKRKMRKIRFVPKAGCREEDMIDAKIGM